LDNTTQLNLDFNEGSAKQLIIEYVSAVLKFEKSEDEADYEACETLWLKMVEFALGAE